MRARLGSQAVRLVVVVGGGEGRPPSRARKKAGGQRACHAQPLVDLEAAVEVRVVDEALPAHRRARLLEVPARHCIGRQVA